MGKFLSDIGLDHGHLWTIEWCQIEFGALLNTKDNKMICPALEIDKKIYVQKFVNNKSTCYYLLTTVCESVTVTP